MSFEQYEAFWLSVHYFVCYHSESVQTSCKQNLAEKVINMLVMLIVILYLICKINISNDVICQD